MTTLYSMKLLFIAGFFDLVPLKFQVLLHYVSAFVRARGYATQVYSPSLASKPRFARLQSGGNSFPQLNF